MCVVTPPKAGALAGRGPARSNRRARGSCSTANCDSPPRTRFARCPFHAGQAWYGRRTRRQGHPCDLLALGTLALQNITEDPTLDREPPRRPKAALAGRRDACPTPIPVRHPTRQALSLAELNAVTESSAGKHPALSLELWVVRTRLEQGLPPHVQDLETLRRVIQLLNLTSNAEDSERQPEPMG